MIGRRHSLFLLAALAGFTVALAACTAQGQTGPAGPAPDTEATVAAAVQATRAIEATIEAATEATRASAAPATPTPAPAAPEPPATPPGPAPSPTPAPRPTAAPQPAADAQPGKLEMRVTDARDPDVKAVVVTIESVQVHRAGSGEWKTAVEGPMSFDLIALSGVEAILGTQPMEAGRYTQVRLEISRVEVYTREGVAEAEVPSGELRLVGTFVLEPGETTIITLDFEVEDSLVRRAGKPMLFKPVVKLKVGEPGAAGKPTVALTGAPPPPDGRQPTPTPSSTPGPPPPDGQQPPPTPSSTPGSPPPDGQQPPPKPTLTPTPSGPPQPPLGPPTPSPTVAPSPTVVSDWVIPEGTGTTWRAAHMGGNWGTTRDAATVLPNEFFEYLRDLNVNWVGISVALHVDGSMDSTVELDYTTQHIPTFTAEVLARMIREYRRHGFNVYLALAFEGGAFGEHPAQRWQLGDPFAAQNNADMQAEFWPWNPSHPDHDRFVQEFWASYTEQAVHIAEIAQAEGAGLYCIGTETDRLFRTRSGGAWPNHFLNEITAMVEAVRAVYSGTLAYEQHYGSTVDRGYFGPGSDYIHKDLGLDVIAVSAYYQLSPEPPTVAPSVLDLEGSWERIFNEYLIPLQERNGGLPILFTEFGYTDSVQSLIQADIDSFIDRVFVDADRNGLDDGEETQANAYEAFFNVVDRHPGVVEGAFLWGHQMSTDEAWNQSFGRMRTFSTRDKLAEEVVRSRYAEWGGLSLTPAPTATPTPTATPAAPGDEVVRLYYYGHEMTPGLDPAAIAGPHAIYSATSSDGINFTEDPGVRFSYDTHSEFGTTDPDVVQLNDGSWLMFLSLGSNLLKGTSPTSDGTFTHDASFQWSQGGVAASYNFDGTVRTFVSHENGIRTATYDQAGGALTPISTALFPPAEGSVGSPSVFQIGDRYHMAYLYQPPGVTDPREHEIYMAESADGMAWSQHADNLYIGNGSVPGAVYFNDTIFVYHCGAASAGPADPETAFGVAISTDGGTTFEHSRVVIEGSALTGAVDPAAIAVSRSSP